MIILGIYNSHDACAALYDDYRLVAAVAQERVTRIKGDGGRFPLEAAEECLAQANLSLRDVDVVCLPRAGYPRSFYRARAFLPFPRGVSADALELIRVMSGNFISAPENALDARRYLGSFGLAPRQIAFYNHHLSHALGALSATEADDALIYTSDGGGDRVYYSARLLRDGRLMDLFGGEPDSLALRRPQGKADSLGNLYYFATKALGFVPNRHEGKVLGLAAFGKPTQRDALRAFYRVGADGQIHGRVPIAQIAAALDAMTKTETREDIAASVQSVLEEVTLEALDAIMAQTRARNIVLAGGVFSNVKLTQRIAERYAVEEVFVYPAMTDQGEAAGGALQFLLERDGLAAWLQQRRRFGNLYFGCDYTRQADAALIAGGARRIEDGGQVADCAAALLADGKILGTYLGRGEYGPRALGARTIMASPADRAINDWLNKRLDRTDFMPFAPVVREERVAECFHLPPSLMYTARFMTVTCDVHESWRARIPAVVHVDGTARPQVLRRSDNPTYADILEKFERLSGLPCAINTSFNVHEEPIINRPEEALRALGQGRVDYLVTEEGVFANS